MTPAAPISTGTGTISCFLAMVISRRSIARDRSTPAYDAVDRRDHLALGAVEPGGPAWRLAVRETDRLDLPVRTQKRRAILNTWRRNRLGSELIVEASSNDVGCELHIRRCATGGHAAGRLVEINIQIFKFGRPRPRKGIFSSATKRFTELRHASDPGMVVNSVWFTKTMPPSSNATQVSCPVANAPVSILIRPSLNGSAYQRFPLLYGILR